MNLAFCLVKYFPYGGLQRDFLHIAEACRARGHDVNVFAGSWQGDIPEGFHVSVLPHWGVTNHGRRMRFVRSLNKTLAAHPFDVVIGFNKLPGLDVYFTADPCFAAKAWSKSAWYRMTRRSRCYLRLERAVFDRHASTRILLLTQREKDLFQKYYDTGEDRFHFLPPGIAKDRLVSDNTGEIRAQVRGELAIAPEHHMVLMVGTGYRRKGVDRAILALAALPRPLYEQAWLVVVGDNKIKPFQQMARASGVLDHVKFLGGRTDVPRFLAAADLLLHPAYREAAGMVLIEAMAAGLPVLATDVCGYGFHIQRADAGLLIPSPFEQAALNQRLARMLASDQRAAWQSDGRNYVARTDVFSLPEKAADIIEQVGA